MMSTTNAERQRKWAKKRNKLAFIAEALQQHDGELFTLLKKAEKLWMRKRQRKKARAA